MATLNGERVHEWPPFSIDDSYTMGFLFNFDAEDKYALLSMNGVVGLRVEIGNGNVAINIFDEDARGPEHEEVRDDVISVHAPRVPRLAHGHDQPGLPPEGEASCGGVGNGVNARLVHNSSEKASNVDVTRRPPARVAQAERRGHL